MNLIIVAKPFTTPRVFRFGDFRSRARLCLGITGLFTLVAALGAVAGVKLLGPAAVRDEVAQARIELEQQRAEVTRLNESVARDMNALTLRLGLLQAEATRLNALGERLAKIGKLEDGEFNFREEPGLGGPTAPEMVYALSGGDVAQAVDDLETQLARQSHQLTMLESLLLDRSLDQSLLPAGMPVRSGYASSGYGFRVDPFTGARHFHAGVDFNGPRGSDILAVAGGVASFVGWKPQYGNVVEIDHGNGYMTRYGHNDRIVVEEGTPVKSGQVISKMGSTGRSTGNHVHFEVWQNGRLANPSQYIRAIR